MMKIDMEERVMEQMKKDEIRYRVATDAEDAGKRLAFHENLLSAIRQAIEEKGEGLPMDWEFAYAVEKKVNKDIGDDREKAAIAYIPEKSYVRIQSPLSTSYMDGVATAWSFEKAAASAVEDLRKEAEWRKELLENINEYIDIHERMERRINEMMAGFGDVLKEWEKIPKGVHYLFDGPKSVLFNLVGEAKRKLDESAGDAVLD